MPLVYALLGICKGDRGRIAYPQGGPEGTGALQTLLYTKRHYEIIESMARQLNPALTKPLTLDAALEAVVGKSPMPRSEVVKQIWVYIKKNNLQNPANKRNILADDKLMPLFGGKKEVTMFEMTKLVSGHMK